jgi:RHS repeat-associated protein
MVYDSFGNSTGTVGTRYRYTGRELDPDAELYYYRARYYDPQARRFISEDPIGLEGGANLYAYVGNNPLSFIDPSGADCVYFDNGGVGDNGKGRWVRCRL